jgi:cytoskeleton protein RodZ
MSETNDAAGNESKDIPTPEVETAASVELDPVAEPEPQLTAGQMLHAARVASGMHIGTLSLALKVPVKKLELLEADDWEHLPDAVFVRALATSVCRQIKTDSAPILAALPKNTSTKILDDKEQAELNQPFHSPNDAKFSRMQSVALSMPLIAGAAVLLLAALLLIFLPDFIKQQSNKKAEVIEKIEPVIAPELAPAIAPAIAASAPGVLPADMSILRLTAKGEVWVEVKDSKGTVLVQRNLQPKEIVNVSGMPPLSVVLGRVNEIESVVVRGKPFNLSPVSSENIARFEVK